MTYPTSLDTLYSSHLGSDSRTDHASLHNQVSIAIMALQTKVGITGSLVETTLDYLIKKGTSPGHKHVLADITDYVSDISNRLLVKADITYVDTQDTNLFNTISSTLLSYVLKTTYDAGILSLQNSITALTNSKADKTSTYTKTEVDTFLLSKVDKITGKGLSTNDFTNLLLSKLNGIAEGAEVNNISDVNATDLTDGGDTTLHTHDSRYYTETEVDTLLGNLDIPTTTDDLTEGAINKYDKVVSLLAGAGIEVTGTYPNFTVANTSPDQVVSLTAGANVVITGTYPNFTIASSGGGGIESIVAGTNITVDNTDPANPKISAAGTGGGQIIYDAIVAPIGGDYTTVGAAITAGKKTIYIKQGVYNETGAIQITTEGVYIQGQEKGTTILRFPTGSDGIQCYSNYSRIDNITIDTQTNGGRAAYVVGDGNIPGNPDVTKGNNNIISNCKILGPNEYGIFTVYVAGASYNAGVDTLTAYENGNLQEGNKIINCEIDGSQSGDMCSYSLQKNGGIFDSKITNGRIAFYMCKSCGVNNNDIIDSEAQGIFFALPSENCTIIGNRIVNSTLQGIKTQTQLEHSPLLAGQGAYGNVISNNTIQGAGDSGIELQDFTSSNSCIGNTIKDIGNHGIYIQGGSVIPTSKNIISNNTILNPKTNPDNTRGSGIYIVQNVIDNTIDGNEIDGTLYHTGIAIREDTSCVGNIISNNTIKGTNTERTIWIESDRTQLIGNNITGGYYAGILIKSNKNLIIGNTLRNNTNEANSVYGEIWLQNNSSDNLIASNYCISDATNKADYAIILSTGCNNNKVYGTKQIGSNGEVYNGGTGNEILSGTNTGDQDLSGYFNKSADDTDDIPQGNNKFVTTTQLQKIENGVMLTNTDANTVTTGGRYGMIGTPTNGAIDGEFYLEVLSDGTRIMQVATYLTGAVYTRYYSGGWSSWVNALSSYTPTSRTITINGTTYDLSANRSWTITAGGLSYSSVTTDQAITSGYVYGVTCSNSNITLTLANGSSVGENLTIKKLDNTPYTITIAGNIELDGSVIIDTQYESLDLFWNGTYYLIK